MIAEAEGVIVEGLGGRTGVHVVGSEWPARYRVREVFDSEAEKLGEIPYTDEAFGALGTTVARAVHALVAPPFKVVAVDADETLWGGVVGEDGALGVVIDGPRRALQERLVAMHEAGVLVCVVSKTALLYDAQAIDDLHEMLKQRGDWVELGSADEQKAARDGTVEAWGRSPQNPVGGWYGLKKGLRGRFGMYLPPLLEALGKAEVEHNARNNRMRAV